MTIDERMHLFNQWINKGENDKDIYLQNFQQNN